MSRLFSIRTTLSLLAVITFSACGALFTKMYGIKKWRTVDTRQIKKYAAKFDVPANVSFILDTSDYLKFLKSIDTALYPNAQKNYAQPLQAMYFTEDGEICCWHINCYAGGFRNLNWERDSLFSTFPPKQQAPLDSLLYLRPLYGMIIPIDSAKRPYSSDSTYVVVFWNRWMGRQSERFIHIVQKNAQGQKANIIYVNNDDLFAGLSD